MACTLGSDQCTKGFGVRCLAALHRDCSCTYVIQVERPQSIIPELTTDARCIGVVARQASCSGAGANLDLFLFVGN